MNTKSSKFEKYQALLAESSIKMSGNKISVKTLDLNISFNNIAAQLNGIAESCFGEVIKKEA